MPIHDWSKVVAGIFHHFHQAWMGELCNSLNRGLLPENYYGLIEQHVGRVEPDILTLHASPEKTVDREFSGGGAPGGLATLADAPPKVDIVEHAEDAWYALKQSGLVVRQVHNDRVVALLEIVSPGNKANEFVVERFVDKVANAIMEGIHVAVIDLHPPGKWDSQGIHHTIWNAVAGQGCELPLGKPLTLASYTGYPEPAAYVKFAAVGQSLFDLPLFLDVEHYVPLPLEETYQSTYAAMPQVWRRRLEA